MLIALMLQAALSAPQAAEPPALDELLKQFHATGRVIVLPTQTDRDCGGKLVQAAKNPNLTSKHDLTTPMTVEPPVYRPGVNPDEGYYSTVNRMVDGCPVATPVFLPNAPKK